MTSVVSEIMGDPARRDYAIRDVLQNQADAIAEEERQIAQVRKEIRQDRSPLRHTRRATHEHGASGMNTETVNRPIVTGADQPSFAAEFLGELLRTYRSAGLAGNWVAEVFPDFAGTEAQRTALMAIPPRREVQDKLRAALMAARDRRQARSE